MTDPISDILTRIRNAQLARKERLKVPYSRVKFEVVNILAKEGFLEEVRKKGRRFKYIEIKLKYDESGKPAISGLRRISKPGQRIYVKSRNIRPIKSGYGIAVISTSKGLMTDKKARKEKLGGEVICEVW